MKGFLGTKLVAIKVDARNDVICGKSDISSGINIMGFQCDSLTSTHFIVITIIIIIFTLLSTNGGFGSSGTQA